MQAQIRFSSAPLLKIKDGTAEEALPPAGKRTTWWLWPHLLSLDAPLVAALWQRWWATAAGVRLGWNEELILALGVWMIYLGDRLGDTAPDLHGDHPTARHYFCHRRRSELRVVTIALFLVLAGVTFWSLPIFQFLAGLGLLAAAGVYFWLVHRRINRRWSQVVPKEAIVGVMFAAGTAFFTLGRPGLALTGWLAALPLFCCLCFCNCALITRWERNPADVRESSSLLNAFPGLTASLGKVCIALAIISGFASTAPHGKVFAPIAISAFALAALDRLSNRFSLDALRVLADVALFTPAFGLVVSLFRP